MLLSLLCRFCPDRDHGLLSLALCSLLHLWSRTINRNISIRPDTAMRGRLNIRGTLLQPAGELAIFLKNQLKRVADHEVAAIVNKPSVAVEHGQLILKEFDGDLLIGPFDAFWVCRKALLISPCHSRFRIPTCIALHDVQNITIFTSPKGGSDPRSEGTSEAGLWRLDRPQTGVAPALGSSPQALIFGLRLSRNSFIERTSLPVYRLGETGFCCGLRHLPTQSAHAVAVAGWYPLVIWPKNEWS
jgi:hypothetical protein